MLISGAPASQALLFTAIAVGIPLLLGWWVFFSPLKAAPKVAIKPRRREAAFVATLLGLGAVAMWIGGSWDAAKHVQTGQVPAGADFLWAPHIMLYSSFLVTLLVASGTVGMLAGDGLRAGVRDPRVWVRQNPYIGAVTVASLYSLLSIPGDAIWHEIFGIDLTAWSPPHLMLSAATTAVVICAVGLLRQGRTGEAGSRFHWIDAASILMLGLALNIVCLVGVLEWEIPGLPIIQFRAAWLYPAVFGVLAFIVLTLGRQVLPRWGATAVAVTIYALRAAMTGGLALADYPLFGFLPVMLLGAILLDVIPFDRIRSNGLRALATGLAYSGGYLAVALPQLAGRTYLKPMTPVDVVMAALVTTAIAAGIVALGRKTAAKMMSPAA